MLPRSEFEQFLARTLWRTGDSALEGDLQYLITMAEARLQRELLVYERIAKATVSSSTPQFTLPEDYYQLIDVSDGQGTLNFISQDEFQRELQPAGRRRRVYTINAVGEIEVGTSVSAASSTDIGIEYYAKLPQFTSAPTWLQDEYFDLYTHACLVHSSPYLREDPRLQVWESLYQANLDSALSRSSQRQWPGSQLQMRLPGVVR